MEFFESEAEESDEDISPKKKPAISDSSEEEEDGSKTFIIYIKS